MCTSHIPMNVAFANGVKALSSWRTFTVFLRNCHHSRHSELGDADIKSILVFADTFEATSYPFTRMLQFSPPSNGALKVLFKADESPFDYLI